MASAIRKLIEEATCSICRDLMTMPITTDCGHNFCYQCIESIIENQQVRSSRGSYHCPLCRAPFQIQNLKHNKQLKNLIESIKEMEHERLCEEHREQLQLFCEDDGQLVCWCCEQSPQHKGHSMALVKDVCPSYKEKIKEIVSKLRKDQDCCEKATLSAREHKIKWEENVELQRGKIQSGFRNLHNFLHEEEKCNLWRLENEKEQVLSNLQDIEARVEKQSLEFNSHNWELEKKRQQSALNWHQEKVERQRKIIQSGFRDLQNFLHEKEKHYMGELENEKEQVLKRLQDDVTHLEKQKLELESLIQDLEKKCQGSAQNLLQDVKDTLKRNSDVKLELPETLSLQPQTVCNFSELYFDVKKRIQSCQVLSAGSLFT